MVFVSQGRGHTSHHLLIGSLHLRGEFLAKVASQHNHQHVAQELWGRGRQMYVRNVCTEWSMRVMDKKKCENWGGGWKDSLRQY